MIIWGIVWGAIIGATLSFFGAATLVFGALIGFFVGWTLRFLVRREIRAGRAALQKELRAEWLKDVQAGLAGVTHASPAAAAAVAAGTGASSASLASSASPASSASSIPAFSGAAAPDLSAAGNEAAWADSLPFGEPPSPAGVKPGVEALPRIDATGLPADAARPAPVAASTARKPYTPPPYEPNAIDRAVVAAKNWLLGGNTIVRVGLVILFIGLSFLASYASSAGFFPIELRLGAIGAAAIALLAVGFRKRHARPGFALALQGAGVAVIYLTVFAAFRLYGLIPPLPAFGLMIVVCALSCVLALLQNARSLAVAAFAGGFAVPLLLSTGQGSHVGLFSYYLLLNLAILVIAYQRSWRVLNLVGYVATFGVATAWGVLKYDPSHYASTQPFLAAFVLIYLAAAIGYARNTPTRLGNAVDSILVFGTPLVGFGLQAGLVRHIEFGMAFSALVFAAVYLGAAMVLARKHLENYRVLIESLIALGVGFATLAVPLALDPRWTSAVWALEGAGAFWVGMRQARWMPRAFGLLMQGVAALVFVATFTEPGANVAAWPLANPAFLGAMFLALPAWALANWLRRPLPHSDSAWARGWAGIERRLADPLFFYAFGFWCLAWVLEVSRRLPVVDVDHWPARVFSYGSAHMLGLIAIVLSAFGAQLLAGRRQWAAARWPSRLTIVVMFVVFGLEVLIGHRVLKWPAWAVWPAVLVLHYLMLRRNDLAVALQAGGAAHGNALQRRVHVAGVWLVTLLLADVLWFFIGRGELWATAWASVVLLFSAIAVLMVLAVWAGRAHTPAARAAGRWPLQPHAEAYYWTAALPLAALVFIGALVVAVSSSGRTEPLPYIPLLNPTDLAIAMGVLGLAFWRRVVIAAQPVPSGSAGVRGGKAAAALAGLAFVALNTVWLRVAHHFFGVPWDADALFESFVVQTGYAILWTLLALGLMVLAHRRAHRTVWLTGAGLLGVVVLKLLLIDQSNAGGAERIVTFIVVGVLMLVVGYFAPLPPKAASASAKAGDGAAPAAALPDAGAVAVVAAGASSPASPPTTTSLVSPISPVSPATPIPPANPAPPAGSSESAP